MANTEKIASTIYLCIVVALFLWCIVSEIFGCVAETRVQIEMIKSGKVPVGVSND